MRDRKDKGKYYSNENIYEIKLKIGRDKTMNLVAR